MLEFKLSLGGQGRIYGRQLNRDPKDTQELARKSRGKWKCCRQKGGQVKKSAGDNRQAIFGGWERVLFGWSRARKRGGDEVAEAISPSREQKNACCA